ncbi:MAG: APC family permease [Puniceicoccales bacterium]|jgi:amino acid transporter|nr:APC family permease [Puniceicoccales bacterium]
MAQFFANYKEIGQGEFLLSISKFLTPREAIPFIKRRAMSSESGSQSKSRPHSMGVFSLAMVNCVAVINLRNLPSMAEYGLGMVFFYAFSVIFFLIPTALVSAELAAGFPEEGGIFNWVSKALGNPLGFLAAWLQLISSAVSFPTSLVYLASLLAYAIGNPDLGSNRYYILFSILTVNWLGTWVTLRGMRLTNFLTNVSSLLGTIIPGIIIILLGTSWIIAGHPSCAELSLPALVPKLNSPEQFVFLLNVLLGFAGLEMSAAHAQDVANPRRDYPRAILLSTLIIFTISLLGSLAIAVSVPKETLTLESGVIQSIGAILGKFGLPSPVQWIAWLMALGVLGWFVAWVAGPARGMLTTARMGNLPPFLQKINGKGMPSTIIIWQAVAITLSSLVFLLLPSVTTCFWILIAVATQVLLIMYILMFISGIVLKFKYPDLKRAYAVPFGKLGMIMTGGLGSIACAVCYLIGFLPPEEIGFKNKLLYFTIVAVGNILVMLPPFIIIRLRKPSWRNGSENFTG